MELLTARFVDQLFGSPSEIMIMDHLAEWNRQHLDARYASAQTYTPHTKVCAWSHTASLPPA
jgi:hypothetical protein